MLLRLRTPATNDRGPLYAEQALAALHQANTQRLPLRLIFATHAGSVGLFIAGQEILQSLVESQLYANYPDCTLDRLSADAADSTSGEETLHADVFLVPDLFPFRRYTQFEDSLNRVTADPLMGILATLAQLARDGFDGRIELVVCPAGRRRPAQARRCLHRLNHPFFQSKPRLSRFTGKTGTGKTTLLQNLLTADIVAGRGVACIDPHGDLADSLLELIPRSRTNDVVVSPSREARPSTEWTAFIVALCDKELLDERYRERHCLRRRCHESHPRSSLQVQRPCSRRS